MPEQKTIIVPLMQGMQARNFLRTRVAGLLADAGTRIVIVAPEYKVEYYRRTITIPSVVVEAMPEMPERGVAGKIKNIALNLLDSPTTRWWIGIRHAHSPKRMMYWRELATSRFGRFAFLRQLARWLFSKTIDPSPFYALFERYKPDAVVLTDMYSKPDIYLFYAARHFGVPDVCFVRSWDNITSKGTCLIAPSNLIVPNELVRQEAIAILGVPGPNITIAGLPHFDYYSGYVPRTDRGTFLRNLGIDEHARYILFSEASGSYQPIIDELLEIVDSAIASGALPSDVRILFRFSPSHSQERNKTFQSERIIFDRPGKHFEGAGSDVWEFTEEDMHYMADSIVHASVVLNFASTVTVDAAALDRPVINIAFDGYAPKETPFSLRTIYRVQHFKSVLASGGTVLAKSPDDFIAAINRYLENPAADKEGRMRMVREQCYRLDGKSSDRIARSILSILCST